MKAHVILSGLLLFYAPVNDQVKGAQLNEEGFYEFNDIKEDTSRLENLRIRSFQLEIIPPSSGVQFYRNGIIFLSYSKVDEKVPVRHVSFGSVRTYTSIIADTLPGSLMPFKFEEPVLFPSEATTFTSDYNTMYLSLIPENLKSEKIFRAIYTQKGWQIDNDPLKICSGDQIYSHPCLSADGSFMIFSSDMPGTKGGLDLFITRKEGENWTRPENLGNDINSTGNELFASLDSNNDLYFSSDGLPGSGGYDIYICKYNGSTWSSPVNLGGKINTKDDELAFAINKSDDQTAFYTSRTRSGKSRSHFYLIDIIPDIPREKRVTISDQLLQSLVGDDNLITAEENLNDGRMISAINDRQETNKARPEMNPEENQNRPEKQITINMQVSNDSVKIVTKDPSPEAIKDEPSGIIQNRTEQFQGVNPDEIIYRVQITASTKPVGSQKFSVAGKDYDSFEYFYQGGYRTTIGEFSTLTEATKLQSLCRKNGYSQAFVVAFKNNIRSTDPKLFK
jgi:hypothetical protein